MAITSYFFLLAKGRYSTICRSTGWLTEYARLLFFFMQCGASRRKHAAGASSGGYSYTVLSHVGGAPSFSASRARARARPNTAEGRYGRGGYALRILASASPPSRGTPNLNEHYYLPTHHVNVKLLR